jgi:hypothetical protein
VSALRATIASVNGAVPIARPAPDGDGLRWPVPWWGPALEPFDRAELFVCREGGPEADDLERLAAVSARARGALDLSIGDGLAALRVGGRLIRLGFSRVTDYAREALGIEERTAQKLAHLSRELASRPLLRAAVRAGEVRIRAAQEVLPVAKGEAEAAWVELARTETVDALTRRVRAVRQPQGEPEPWRRLRIGVAPEEREVIDEGLRVAGRVLGPGSSRVDGLEALAQEYVGEHSLEAGDDPEQPAIESAPAPRQLRGERRRAELAAETERWAYLAEAPILAAVEGAFGEDASAEELDAGLRRLGAMRASWDRLVGPAAYAVKASGLWKDLGFADFDHYCAERLGLAARTVEERAAVEGRLWEVPLLRAELVEGRLSYEQVRLLSGLRDADIPAWISRARGLTCIELRRALEAEDEAQMRAAGNMAVRVPRRVALVLAAAYRAVRAVEGQPFWGDGRCLAVVARHFLDVWGPAVRRRTRSQRIRERDLGHCQVPMCSRPAAHAHHVQPRGRGGGDEGANQVGLCAVHHLRGVHGGYIRVTGTAPGGLVWELGGTIWMGPQQACATEQERAAHDPHGVGARGERRERRDPGEGDGGSNALEDAAAELRSVPRRHEPVDRLGHRRGVVLLQEVSAAGQHEQPRALDVAAEPPGDAGTEEQVARGP